jgi:hypothetical protein
MGFLYPMSQLFKCSEEGNRVVQEEALTNGHNPQHEKERRHQQRVIMTTILLL